VDNVISIEHDHHMEMGTGCTSLAMWFDACAGQCNNWILVMYHLYITDPDLGMLMYDRLIENIPEKGHTYIEPDRGFGDIQQAARGLKTIADMQDWMDIARGANKKHPFRVVEFKQGMHRDWTNFLKQFFVKGRKDVDGEKVLLQGSKIRSYGKSPVAVVHADGTTKIEMVSHPGEVWMKYSFRDDEDWTKLDMRRWTKKGDRYKLFRDEDGFASNAATEVLAHQS
jgi:hypothetical protein